MILLARVAKDSRPRHRIDFHCDGCFHSERAERAFIVDRTCAEGNDEDSDDT